MGRHGQLGGWWWHLISGGCTKTALRAEARATFDALLKRGLPLLLLFGAKLREFVTACTAAAARYD